MSAMRSETASPYSWPGDVAETQVVLRSIYEEGFRVVLHDQGKFVFQLKVEFPELEQMFQGTDDVGLTFEIISTPTTPFEDIRVVQRSSMLQPQVVSCIVDNIKRHISKEIRTLPQFTAYVIDETANTIASMNTRQEKKSPMIDYHPEGRRLSELGHSPRAYSKKYGRARSVEPKSPKSPESLESSDFPSLSDTSEQRIHFLNNKSERGICHDLAESYKRREQRIDEYERIQDDFKGICDTIDVVNDNVPGEEIQCTVTGRDDKEKRCTYIVPTRQSPSELCLSPTQPNKFIKISAIIDPRNKYVDTSFFMSFFKAPNSVEYLGKKLADLFQSSQKENVKDMLLKYSIYKAIGGFDVDGVFKGDLEPTFYEKLKTYYRIITTFMKTGILSNKGKIDIREIRGDLLDYSHGVLEAMRAKQTREKQAEESTKDNSFFQDLSPDSDEDALIISEFLSLPPAPFTSPMLPDCLIRPTAAQSPVLSSSNPTEEHNEMTDGQGNQEAVQQAYPYQSRLQDEYEIISVLGRGGFGEVLKVRSKIDGNYYALKKVIIDNKDAEMADAMSFIDIQREVLSLSLIKSKHVVRYYTAWIEQNVPVTTLNDIEEEEEEHTAEEALPPLCEDEDQSENSYEYVYEDEEEDFSECEISVGRYEDWYSSSDQKTSNSSTKIKKVTKTYHTLFILMEMCNNGTLRTHLPIYPDIYVYKIIIQLIVGLSDIHAKQIIHRDIKPENIFMDENMNAQIGDFGFSYKYNSEVKQPKESSECFCNITTGSADDQLSMCDLNREESTITRYQTFSPISFLGSGIYMAPEIGQDTYDEKVDIYAMGIVLFEILYPFRTEEEREQVLTSIVTAQVPRNAFPRDWAESNPFFSRLIGKMIDKNPKQRPSAATILKLLLNTTAGYAYSKLTEIVRPPFFMPEQDKTSISQSISNVVISLMEQAGLPFKTSHERYRLIRMGIIPSESEKTTLPKSHYIDIDIYKPLADTLTHVANQFGFTYAPLISSFMYKQVLKENTTWINDVSKFCHPQPILLKDGRCVISLVEPYDKIMLNLRPSSDRQLLDKYFRPVDAPSYNQVLLESGGLLTFAMAPPDAIWAGFVIQTCLKELNGYANRNKRYRGLSSTVVIGANAFTQVHIQKESAREQRSLSNLQSRQEFSKRGKQGSDAHMFYAALHQNSVLAESGGMGILKQLVGVSKVGFDTIPSYEGKLMTPTVRHAFHSDNSSGFWVQIYADNTIICDSVCDNDVWIVSWDIDALSKALYTKQAKNVFPKCDFSDPFIRSLAVNFLHNKLSASGIVVRPGGEPITIKRLQLQSRAHQKLKQYDKLSMKKYEDATAEGKLSIIDMECSYMSHDFDSVYSLIRALGQ